MMNRKSFTLIMLCLLMLVPLFGACQNADANDSLADASSAAVSSTSEVSSVSGEASEAPFPYEGKFDKELTIYCVNTDRHVYGELQFAPNDESSGSHVNDAVAERNNTIKEKYGLTIKTVTDKNPTENLKTLIQGGSADFDIVCDSVDRMVGSVTEKLFWSIDDLVDINNPWWDKDCIESLTLSDSHYFLAGDALITDDDHTYLTLFNKNMYNENSAITSKYGDIYQLVRDYKFTYDAYYEMCKAVSKTDTNGNWSPEATYGNLSHSYGATIMFNGSGTALANKSSDGGIVINVTSERAVQVFDEVYKLMSNNQMTIRAEQLIGKLSAVKSTYGFAELEYLFVNGRGLFYNTTSASISILKSSTEQRDFEFGVLPIPMFDESQGRYYCPVNRYQSSVLGIPTCNTANLEEAAFLLEALGYYSKDVTEAYYKITLQLQAVDEDADAEMLDIIYNSRFYDLGAIYTWGGLAGLQGSVIADPAANNLISKWEAMQGTVEDAKNKTVQDYKDNLS